MPTIEEILALDRIALREHISDTPDFERHRKLLQTFIPFSQICSVYRKGSLVAYAMMHREEDGSWFVTAFNTNPEQRTVPVLRELFTKFTALIGELGVTELQSSVYKNNKLSLALHRRLGFRVVNESAKKFELRSTISEVTASFSRTRLGRSLGIISSAAE